MRFHNPQMSLELRLLISCLRVGLGREEEGDRIRTLCRRSVHWKKLMELTDRHRVISQVYEGLKRYGGSSVPRDVPDDLNARHRRSVQQVMAKTGELVRLLKRFRHSEIPVLPLKGPVLSLQVYGGIGQRHVGDLDLLVQPDRIQAAERLLVQEGYERTEPDFELTPRQTMVYFRNTQHFGYTHRISGVRVELHWRIGRTPNLFPLEFDTLWNARQPLNIPGGVAPAFSLTHTILLLCTHGAGHNWFRLFWLNDVAQLITKTEAIDWDMVMDYADRLGLGRMVAEGVVLGNFLLGCPLPAPVRDYADSDRSLEKFTTMALHLIRSPQISISRRYTRAFASSKIRKFMLRKGLRYKLAVAAGILEINSKDWKKFPLPDVLFPLYYPIRSLMWLFRRISRIESDNRT